MRSRNMVKFLISFHSIIKILPGSIYLSYKEKNREDFIIIINNLVVLFTTASVIGKIFLQNVSKPSVSVKNVHMPMALISEYLIYLVF